MYKDRQFAAPILDLWVPLCMYRFSAVKMFLQHNHLILLCSQLLSNQQTGVMQPTDHGKKQSIPHNPADSTLALGPKLY
jgi:hypothetical protein